MVKGLSEETTQTRLKAPARILRTECLPALSYATLFWRLSSMMRVSCRNVTRSPGHRSLAAS